MQEIEQKKQLRIEYMYTIKFVYEISVVLVYSFHYDDEIHLKHFIKLLTLK